MYTIHKASLTQSIVSQSMCFSIVQSPFWVKLFSTLCPNQATFFHVIFISVLHKFSLEKQNSVFDWIKCLFAEAFGRTNGKVTNRNTMWPMKRLFVLWKLDAHCMIFLEVHFLPKLVFLHCNIEFCFANKVIGTWNGCTDVQILSEIQ